MRTDHLAAFDPTAPLSEQASFWWVLLNNSDWTLADHQAFGEWVSRSPERVELFLRTARLTRVLKSNKLRWPDTPVMDLIRQAKESAASDVIEFGNANATHTPVAPAHTSAAGREQRRSFADFALALRSPAMRLPRAIASGAAVVITLAVGLFLYSSPERYATAVGEQRSVVLADGSVVMLNTSSVIEVRIRKDHRIVKLLSGEVLFQVAHDVTRPFDVGVGDTTVRALGTQFNVSRKAASTTVTVVEGKVAIFNAPDDTKIGPETTEVSKLPLEAGEQVTVRPRTVVHAVHADVARATAWTQRKLVFEHQSLGDVANEFNRYNRQIIEIRGAELRAQDVTGVFEANEPDSFVKFLARIPDVSVEKSPDGTRFIVTLDSRDSVAQ